MIGNNKMVLRLFALICIMAVTGLMQSVMKPAMAQEAQRNPLQRADLITEAETEVVMTELILVPGSSIPRHSHPGDEYVYIVDGGSAETLDGMVVEFASGQSLMYPRGLVHGGFTVTGSDTIKVVTIHIVDKGVDLLVPATD